LVSAHRNNLQTLVERRERREFIPKHVEVFERCRKCRKTRKVGVCTPQSLQSGRKIAQKGERIVAEFQLLQTGRKSMDLS
jgi:hypothetical protein